MFSDKWHCHRNICVRGMNTREPEFRSCVQLLEPLTPRWDWNPSPDQNCLQISSCPVPYPLRLWISCHRKSFRKTLPDQRITKLSFSPASIFYYFTGSVLDPLRVLMTAWFIVVFMWFCWTPYPSGFLRGEPCYSSSFSALWALTESTSSEWTLFLWTGKIKLDCQHLLFCFFFFKELFFKILCVLLAYMPEWRCRIPWNWSYRQSWSTMEVLNPSLLEERLVLLITEPSLQPPNIYSYCKLPL